MTATAAVLAILVATGDAQAPEIASMMAAAAEVAGTPDAIRLVSSAAPSDAEALQAERAASARASVQLIFSGSDRRRARLRLHASRTDRWIDREIVFSPGDSVGERGRTLGFAMASMLPEGDPTLRLERPAASAPAAPTRPLGRYAATVAACVGTGLGGPAGNWGGSLAFEWFTLDGVSLGAKAGARTGQSDTVAARVITTAAGAGGAWWPLAPSPEQRLGLALRADALLLYHRVSHERTDGSVEWKGYALPGADLLLDATYRLAGPLELLVEAGAEVAFGTIDVTVVATGPGAGSARIPALRALAAFGIRLRF